jgi:hypothetical protein
VLQDSIAAAAVTSTTATTDVATELNARVDVVTSDMSASKTEMDAAMEDLAQGVKVLQTHADNVVACTQDGLAHNGEDCVPLIPTCVELSTPSKGTLVTSGHSSESTPGVSAMLTCDEGTYPDGAAKVTCLSTGEWSAGLATCARCALDNCIACSSKTECKVGGCKAGFKLDTDSNCVPEMKSCKDYYDKGAREDGIYTLTSDDGYGAHF